MNHFLFFFQSLWTKLETEIKYRTQWHPLNDLGKNITKPVSFLLFQSLRAKFVKGFIDVLFIDFALTDVWLWLNVYSYICPHEKKRQNEYTLLNCNAFRGFPT